MGRVGRPHAGQRFPELGNFLATRLFVRMVGVGTVRERGREVAGTTETLHKSRQSRGARDMRGMSQLSTHVLVQAVFG